MQQTIAATIVLLGRTAPAGRFVRNANILTDASRASRQMGDAAGAPPDTDTASRRLRAADAAETRSAVMAASARKDQRIVSNATQQKSFVSCAKLGLGWEKVGTELVTNANKGLSA